MIYYPPNLKYVDIPQTESHMPNSTYDPQLALKPAKRVKTNHWALSIILSWVVAIHLYAQPADFLFLIIILNLIESFIQASADFCDVPPSAYHVSRTCPSTPFSSVFDCPPPKQPLHNTNSYMGHFLGCFFGDFSGNTICATNIPHLSHQTRRRIEYQDDVNANPWNRFHDNQYRITVRSWSSLPSKRCH